MNVFDDLGGRFEARLRDHRVVTRTTRMREGDVTLASPVAVLEVRFDFDVLDRLHQPSFVGIERSTSQGSTYLIYEVAGLRPTHFQMLGMDVSMPTVIRKEYLNTIDGSWGKSDETWIDVVSVPTKYRMDLREDRPEFSKAVLAPLTGSRAYLLSVETVREFLCVDGGTSVGSLIGFDIPLTVRMDNMVRYHSGVFGFTGSGKSNLISCLLRKTTESVPDLKIAIFDVAGEYSIHLLDLLAENGGVYSTEDFRGGAADFLNSQVIPETLEEKLSEERIQKKIDELFAMERVGRISLAAPAETTAITLQYLISILQNASGAEKSGAIQAALALEETAKYFITGRGYDDRTPLADVTGEDKKRLLSILSTLASGIHGMSSLKLDLTALMNHIESAEVEAETTGEVSEDANITPERLAASMLREDCPRLNVIYVPEPDEARLLVSRFIDRLLLKKKTSRARQKVLVVLDEAQEFIPDRTVKGDNSEMSNRSVEALLRQGRKYRAHCWLSTQRVAHLNVNAIQQLHSYFVSTLPRFYDRMVIADAFSLSYEMLERTTDLDTGQWLFVSYKAAKQKNVPAFVQAPNNEEILARSL